jgi:bacterioferritin-associated ferredoxin
MIICVCHRVSHHDITRAVREGCSNFDELQMALGVATRCGACRSCAVEQFDAAQGSTCHPVPVHAAIAIASALAA